MGINLHITVVWDVLFILVSLKNIEVTVQKLITEVLIQMEL